MLALSVSSNIPKYFRAVGNSSDPFIVGLSSINNVQRHRSGYPFYQLLTRQLEDKHHDECKGCCQKRPRQVIGGFCNKTSPCNMYPLNLYVGYPWLPYTSSFRCKILRNSKLRRKCFWTTCSTSKVHSLRVSQQLLIVKILSGQ